MHIHITPRHLKLTGAIHSYVGQKIEHLETYADDLIAAHVVLWFDESRSAKQKHRVKVHLAVPGKDIHAEEQKEDLYAAIDLVTHKLERLLRKRKTNLTSKKRSAAQKTKEKKKTLGLD